jgi:UrcA family protein
MFQSKIRYLAAVATAVLAVAANAGTPTQMNGSVPSLTVRYDDLDLTTQQGIAILHRRIRYAASQVCPLTVSADLGQIARAHACQNQAIERAERAVGNPMLADQAADRRKSSH